MSSWREIQKKSFRSMSQLGSFLELEENQQEKLLAHSDFPLLLPLRLAQKIEKNNLNDPLLLQFVPLVEETQSPPHYCCDPLEENRFKKTGKLLVKYQSRALLLTTSACAMNCRFCFRRHFAYETTSKSFEKELAYVRSDSSIAEIILSGGDPLSLNDQDLERLLQDCEHISHIKRIRFHTRFPIGIPERVSYAFLNILSRSSKQIFFVIHVNHPKELDDDVIKSLKEIHRLGIPILSQTVLLKRVNDSVEVLKELFLSLVDQGFIPYYLHMLDETEGASHFEVTRNKAEQIHRELSSQLSGYAVPKLVKEIAGQSSKTPV